MLRTPQQLVTRALRTIGAHSAGDTLPAQDLNDGFDVLKSMLDGWKLNNLTVLTIERALFPLVVGQREYTIGPGGDFDRQRPVWLTEASVIFVNNPSQPLELPIDVYTVGQYQQVPVKATEAGVVSEIYYDHSYEGGLGRISVYPVPNQPIGLALYCPTSIEGFTSLTEVVDLPPGYDRAINYNLAVELMPEWGAPDNARAIEAIANESLTEVQTANTHPVIIGVDAAIVARGNRWNYITGDYRRP